MRSGKGRTLSKDKEEKVLLRRVPEPAGGVEFQDAAHGREDGGEELKDAHEDGEEGVDCKGVHLDQTRLIMVGVLSSYLCVGGISV